MNKRMLSRALAVALPSALVLAASAAFGAPPVGPVYPLPGGPGTGHGGSTCLAASSVEAAMGKTALENGTPSPGQTWFFGGGSDPAQTGPGCPSDPTPGTSVTPFDTTRFDRLFWGESSAPELALDGVVDSTAGTVETLVLSTADSDLAGGKLVWTGSTRMTWCVPVSCGTFTTTTVPVRFELTATSLAGAPVALVDPASVEVDPATGGLVEVTPALRNFKVNIVMLAQHPTERVDGAGHLDVQLAQPPDRGPDPQTQMGFGAAFRYVNRAPTGTIGHGTVQENQPVTFTATASDPDGTVVSYAWALGADGVFDDGTGPTAQGTFGLGTHTVRARVTDDDGTTTTLSNTFTVTDATAPIATVAVSGKKLSKILKRGLKTTTSTNEAGTIALSVTIPNKVAKKLKLKNPVAAQTVPAATRRCLPRHDQVFQEGREEAEDPAEGEVHGHRHRQRRLRQPGHRQHVRHRQEVATPQRTSSVFLPPRRALARLLPLAVLAVVSLPAAAHADWREPVGGASPVNQLGTRNATSSDLTTVARGAVRRVERGQHRRRWQLEHDPSRAARRRRHGLGEGGQRRHQPDQPALLDVLGAPVDHRRRRHARGSPGTRA